MCSSDLDTGIRVTGVSCEFVPGNDANFAVRVGAFADELDAGRDDKIALDFFPQKVKLICLVPHVDARTFHGVLLGFRIVSRRAFDGRIAHIFMVVKYAQFVLCDQVERKNAECEKEYCFHVVLFIVPAPFLTAHYSWYFVFALAAHRPG